LDDHIQKGKVELNFNEFNTYSSRRKMSKLRSIESSINKGTMPLPSYTLIHSNTILSERDKALLMTWLEDAKESVAK
jgi:hypothetical protein